MSFGEHYGSLGVPGVHGSIISARGLLGSLCLGAGKSTETERTHRSTTGKKQPVVGKTALECTRLFRQCLLDAGRGCAHRSKTVENGWKLFMQIYAVPFYTKAGIGQIGLGIGSTDSEKISRPRTVGSVGASANVRYPAFGASLPGVLLVSTAYRLLQGTALSRPASHLP
ncbi:hypothetical protein ZHAS_00003618 [Anopheles sinensis]|uniref:Uncharacterized protein n=1 Tax=Anopheles sinensis TaxID=74873 RepID=A0A084VEU4_ANOSI|nr:hypothetical protein ZHAS_00003618 [Anopheles sinensis]